VSNETIIHSATVTREVTEDGGNTWRITAEAKLTLLEGNQAPYFSCTGHIDERSRNGRWNVWVSGGCIHDEILQYVPEFNAVVYVHLADEHGRPMHAAANACYWAGVSGVSPKDRYARYEVEVDDIDGREWAPTMLAEHLRVPIDEARHIRREIALYRLNTWNPVVGTKRNYAPEMGAILARHDLPARWQADADAAIAVILAVNTP
jgi:hypothetical protein